MIEGKLLELCERAREAHANIQAKHAKLDPVIGVNQKMRQVGMPVDIITIDCVRSNKRIIAILNDDQPDMVSYQYSFKDQDPSDQFEMIAFESVTTLLIVEWIESYFLD